MKQKIKLNSAKNKIFKRAMHLFLVILMLTTTLSSAVFAEEGVTFPRYEESQLFGRGSWSAVAHHGAVCYDKNNNPLLCFPTQGGFFYVVDLATGKVKSEYNIIGEYTYAEFVRCGPDNKVYVYFYPAHQFNVYDPIAETLEMCDTPDEYNFYAQDGGCMTDEGIAYLGSYTAEGASVYSYDIYTGETKQYGPLDPNCHYVKGVTTDDKYIYAGTGVGAEFARIIRIDKETGEQTDFLWNTGGGIIYTAYMINGKIIAHTNGRFHIVDPKTLEKENEIPTSHSRVGDLIASPYNDKVFYHYCTGAIWEYNTETQEHRKITDSPLTVGLQWAKLPDGKWVLAMRTEVMEQVGYFDPQTGIVTAMQLDKIADAGPYVQCLEISDDGILYCGGYQSSMGAYNINTGDYLYSFPKWHQNEGTGFLNGKTYFGTYTDAVMYRYDPEKPLTDHYLSYNYSTKYDGYDANPSMILDIEQDQDRPFVVEGYQDKLYIGTMSGYGKSGGALVIMSEEDGENPPEAEVYHHVVPGHSLTGIAVKDNLIYIGSTVRNGKGIYENPEGYAQIAVFDTEKKEVIKRITPEFPAAGYVKTIGELSFGTDGLLWGATEKEGLIFAMDPDTLEIQKYVVTVPGDDRKALARPLYLRWSDDGLLYTTAGRVFSVIDPKTMQFKNLVDNVALMTLDHNGNIWYTTDNALEISYIAVNQYDRLQGFLKTLEALSESNYTAEEWAALCAEIAKAKVYTEETDDKVIQNTIRDIKGLRDKEPYAEPQNEVQILINGEKLELDYDTTGVTRMYQDRTLVPYRVILETLGYEVNWDVHTNTVTAKKEGSELSMKMNSKIYTVNGKEVEFDTPPVLLGGRHYLPIRLIAESLGYEVIWNEAESTVELNKK